MKQFFLLLTFLCSVHKIAAQETFPVKGVFKQTMLACDGQQIATPQLVYKNYGDRHALYIFWVRDLQGDKLFSWRMDEAPNPEDPLCQKFRIISQDSMVFTWYNSHPRFINFPTNKWVDEEWVRVENDDNVNGLSDAFVHHNSKLAKGKLTGTWRLTATKYPDETGETLLERTRTYKIYGEKFCVELQGSIYNIEAGQPCILRSFKMESESKIVEGSRRYSVTFNSPTKITVEYNDRTVGKCIETWVRYDLPEPVASLFSSFK